METHPENDRFTTPKTQAWELAIFEALEMACIQGWGSGFDFTKF